MPLPERIRNAPQLWFGLELYYRAFWSLSSSRSFGFGEGPLPWIVIDRYCQANDIVGEQREDLFFFLEQMDNAYLTWKRDHPPKPEGK